jgi:hypothetical protein
LHKRYNRSPTRDGSLPNSASESCKSTQSSTNHSRRRTSWENGHRHGLELLRNTRMIVQRHLMKGNHDRCRISEEESYQDNALVQRQVVLHPYLHRMTHTVEVQVVYYTRKVRINPVHILVGNIYGPLDRGFLTSGDGVLTCFRSESNINQPYKPRRRPAHTISGARNSYPKSRIWRMFSAVRHGMSVDE